MLSILIPSIPERLSSLNAKYYQYETLASRYGVDVEIVSICDNKKRSIGQKRTDLINLVKGEYLVMVDDDADKLTRRFFENINKAMDSGSDVITYYQFARINSDMTFVDFGLNNPTEYQKHMGVTLRPAWHCCTWKTSVVKGLAFGDTNYGEDAVFAKLANAAAKTEYKINDVCHIYEHDSELTSAPGDERYH